MFGALGHRQRERRPRPRRPSYVDPRRSANLHRIIDEDGPHFSRRYFVAKMQARGIVDQSLHRAPDLRVEEPTYPVGSFVRAVKSMPCTVR